MRFRFLAPVLASALGLVATGCGSSSPSGQKAAGGAGVGGATVAHGTGGRAAAGGATGAGGATTTPGAGGATTTPGVGGAGGRANGGATGSAGTTGAAGMTGAAGTTGAGGANGANLGKTCATNTDCGATMLCLKPTDQQIFGQQGPAHGYCTVPCAAMPDLATCTALGGTCLNLAATTTDPAEGFCLKNCTYADGSDVTTKCQGRPDVACTPLFDNMGNPAGSACVPLCSIDADCPTGRFCDLQTGSCSNTASTGDKLGAHCTPDPTTGASSCAGICQQFGSAAAVTATFCTQPCVLGQPNACNPAAANMSLASGTHGACAFSGDQNAGLGDQGLCARECDTIADCPDTVDPNGICDVSEMSVIGHGVCAFN